VAVVLLAVFAAGAWPRRSKCVPEAAGKAIETPTAGVCKAKYVLEELGTEGKEGPAGKEGSAGKEGKEGKEGKSGAKGEKGETGKEGKTGKEGPEGKIAGLSSAEAKKLVEILPYIKFVEKEIDGKPTIQFSGANVQVLSSAGKEETPNGEGNLIVGYDESLGRGRP
jgi:hypothetical protein